MSNWFLPSESVRQFLKHLLLTVGKYDVGHCEEGFIETIRSDHVVLYWALRFHADWDHKYHSRYEDADKSCCLISKCTTVWGIWDETHMWSQTKRPSPLFSVETSRSWELVRQRQTRCCMPHVLSRHSTKCWRSVYDLTWRRPVEVVGLFRRSRALSDPIRLLQHRPCYAPEDSVAWIVQSEVLCTTREQTRRLIWRRLWRFSIRFGGWC